MPAPWFGKKDHGDVDSSEESTPSDGDRSSDIEQLSKNLGQLQEPIEEKLDKVADGLSTLSDAVEDEGDSSVSLKDVLDAVNQQGAAFSALVRQLEGQLAGGLQELVDLVSPEEEPEGDSQPAGPTALWQSAILGPDLAENPALAFKCQELLDGILEGDPTARSFAGQLLVFQSAPVERLPQLLKEVGEAYYRWQPRKTAGTNPMEDALVSWLRKTCEAAGIGNMVELVHPGERFDSSRHNATSRGVEITEVHGWIVLRDNGRVYTKASVAVR